MPDEPPEENIKRYLKMRDVCEYLCVTDETICKWIRNAGMPAHKIGKQWLFSQLEIDSLVVNHNSKRGKAKKSSARQDIGGFQNER